MRKRFEGKVAVVTGGAMGMGNGSAKVLGREGCKLILLDKSPKVADAVAELKKNGIEAVGYEVDVRDAKGVKEAVDKGAKHFGKVDILVNVAGIARYEPFLETSEESRDLTFGININGMWNTAQAAIPYMVKNKYGRIVNFCSVSGYMVADPGVVAYGTSKAAILGFTKCLAAEFAADGITSNCLCPGYILTPMTETIAKNFNPENPQQVIDDIAAGCPIPRLGTMEEAGLLVAFLASDDAAYITGTPVLLDGGSTLPETKAVAGTGSLDL